MLTQKPRAMVLVITLLISAIIALFLVSTVKMLPVLGFSSVNLEDKELAMAAARSGIDYARARLQEDPAWRGDANELVVDTPEFKVVEDNGNVFGFITPANGPPSQFRFRFNYQNGGSTTPQDDLPDPTFPIDSPYVSYNNLKASYGRPQYRAVLSSGTWKVTSSSPTAENLPKYTAALIVEGFAGPAMSDISTTSPLVSASKKKYTTQVLEVYLTRPGFVSVDSAVMAATDLDAQLKDGQTMKVDSSEAGAPARVRSLNRMDVGSTSNSANYQMPPGGEVVVNLGQDFLLNNLPSTSPSATRETPTEQAPHWLKVGFDDVQRAPSTGTKLKAGTYVWETSGLGGAKLTYYPENYDPTKTYSGGTVINTGNDMLASGSGAVSLQSSKLSMTFKDQVYVEPQGAATDFTVVSQAGLMSALGQRPDVVLAPPTTSDSVIISNDSGSVHFEGRVEGKGSITSVQDITFQGSSVLEADPNSSVAMYAKGDVNLKAIPEELLPAISGTVLQGQGSFNHSFRRNNHGHRGFHGNHFGLSSGGGSSSGSSGGSSGGSGGGTNVVFSGAADVAFAGVVYAQGQFTADLRSIKQDGTAGTGLDGSLYIEGLLATYGGDPAVNNSPGADPLKGNVKLNVADATFIFAPEYMDSLVGIDAPSRLEQSFWSEL